MTITNRKHDRRGTHTSVLNETYCFTLVYSEGPVSEPRSRPERCRKGGETPCDLRVKLHLEDGRTEGLTDVYLVQETVQVTHSSCENNVIR